jgi:hypothetical protein
MIIHLYLKDNDKILKEFEIKPGNNYLSFNNELSEYNLLNIVVKNDVGTIFKKYLKEKLVIKNLKIYFKDDELFFNYKINKKTYVYVDIKCNDEIISNKYNLTINDNHLFISDVHSGLYEFDFFEYKNNKYKRIYMGQDSINKKYIEIKNL